MERPIYTLARIQEVQYAMSQGTRQAEDRRNVLRVLGKGCRAKVGWSTHEFAWIWSSTDVDSDSGYDPVRPSLDKYAA